MGVRFSGQSILPHHNKTSWPAKRADDPRQPKRRPTAMVNVGRGSTHRRSTVSNSRPELGPILGWDASAEGEHQASDGRREPRGAALKKPYWHQVTLTSQGDRASQLDSLPLLSGNRFRWQFGCSRLPGCPRSCVLIYGLPAASSRFRSWNSRQILPTTR